MNLVLIVLEGIDGISAIITAKVRLRFLAIVLQLIVGMLPAEARLYACGSNGRTVLRFSWLPVFVTGSRICFSFPAHICG
jgi:hypothetical protein